MKIKIAVVISNQGHMRCCGPDDYDEADARDEMSAARLWTVEAGEIVVSSWWLETEIPDPVREIRDVKITEHI